MPRDNAHPAATRPVVLVAGVEYPPTLSTAQVAALLSCSSEWLQQAARSGDLPAGLVAHRLGTRLRWPTAAVAAALGWPVEVRHVAAALPEPALTLVSGSSSGAEPGGPPVNGERPDPAGPVAATDIDPNAAATQAQGRS